MKITLEKPYSDVWKWGYLNKGANGRKIVNLYNGATENSVTSYARYLMAVKLGRFLTDQEQVDHIDNDKTNDALDNLQILTEQQNLDKYIATLPHARHGTTTMYRKGCRCSLCTAHMRDYNKRYKETHPNVIAHYAARRKNSKAIKLICRNCGKPFYRSYADRKTRFCCLTCANRFNGRQRRQSAL